MGPYGAHHALKHIYFSKCVPFMGNSCVLLSGQDQYYLGQVSGTGLGPYGAHQASGGKVSSSMEIPLVTTLCLCYISASI